MRASILKQGKILIASVQGSMSDADLVQLGLTMEGTSMALDLEEGLAQLRARDRQEPLDADG